MVDNFRGSICFDVDGSGLAVDVSRIRLFLRSMLLGAETNSKASAKSKFLANVATNHCTSEMGGSQGAESNSTEGTFLPNRAIFCNSFAFDDFFTSGQFSVFLTLVFTNVFNLVAHVFNLGDYAINRPLPLLVLMLWLMVVVMHLDLHIVALFLLLYPALRLIPTLLGVLSVASLLIFRSTDFRIFCRALLRRLLVASFTWLVPTLLRVFSFTFFVELFVTLLIKLCVALLMVRRLAQFFILSLALCVVLRLTRGAVLCLTLVLVLLHAHLFVMSLAVRSR